MRNVSPHRILIYAALFAYAAFVLSPIYVVVVTSAKGLDEIRQGGLLSFPHDMTFAAWAKAWNHSLKLPKSEYRATTSSVKGESGRSKAPPSTGSAAR